jgi:hypothetical protein
MTNAYIYLLTKSKQTFFVIADIVNTSLVNPVEQSSNVICQSQTVMTTESTESVNMKSIIQSAQSVKSIIATATRSQESQEIEETIEYEE